MSDLKFNLDQVIGLAARWLTMPGPNSGSLTSKPLDLPPPAPSADEPAQKNDFIGSGLPENPKIQNDDPATSKGR